MLAPWSGIEYRVVTNKQKRVLIGAIVPDNQQISNIRRISGAEANKPFISYEALAQGWLPPYTNSAGVRTFTTADDFDGFVRVHVKENKPQGGFLVREKEIAHLNGDAEKIRVYLGLKDKPAFISDVKVPANIKMQTGRIGAQPNFGLDQTSGFQYQLLEEIPKSSIFQYEDPEMKLNQSQLLSIDEAVDLGAGKKVVRLDYSAEKHLSEDEHNFNVFCIDDENNVIWRITSDSSDRRDSFVSIEMVEGILKADRFFGGEFEIDIQSGVAKKVGWHK